MSESDRMESPEHIITTQYGLVLYRGGCGVAYYPQGISPLSILLKNVRRFEIQATDYFITGSKSRDLTKRFIALQRRIRNWILWRREVLRHVKSPKAFLNRGGHQDGVRMSQWVASRQWRF
jgi:hypothetical protein